MRATNVATLSQKDVEDSISLSYAIFVLNQVFLIDKDSLGVNWCILRKLDGKRNLEKTEYFVVGKVTAGLCKDSCNAPKL